MPGANLELIKGYQSSIYSVQLRDQHGQWRTWSPIHPAGLNLGRSIKSAGLPFLDSMAPRHLHLFYEGGRLMAEDVGSLNGVYLRVTEPEELTAGSRFRIGEQVIEFNPVDPSSVWSNQAPDDPDLMVKEGEQFLSCEIVPIAYLDLIRPNNRPGVRIPILSQGVTTLGRDPSKVNHSIRAEFVSSAHAQIRCEDNRYWLEDLKSRNGTFIQFRGRRPLRDGDELMVGRAFLRVTNQSS